MPPPCLATPEITTKPRPAEPGGAAARGQSPFGGAASRADDGAASIATNRLTQIGTPCVSLCPKWLQHSLWPSPSLLRLALSIDTQCVGAFPCCPPASAWGSVPFSKPTAPYPQESMHLSLNAGSIFAKSPWHYCPTALTHVLVNGFGWQGTAAPLAPCCNGAAQSFFPWAAPIPRGTRNPGLPRPPLRCGPASHPKSKLLGTPGVQRCKPLPETSHRGRE